MKKIYFGAPLFSKSEQMFNDFVANKIDELNKFKIYVPQRNEAINDKRNCATAIQIYDGDTNELLTTDILIAVIDGLAIDPGLATEIGWFAREIELNPNSNKIILGLYTDCRDGTNVTIKETLDQKAAMLNNNIAESQFSYVNLYSAGAIKKYGKLFKTVEELIDFLKKY